MRRSHGRSYAVALAAIGCVLLIGLPVAVAKRAEDGPGVSLEEEGGRFPPVRKGYEEESRRAQQRARDERARRNSPEARAERRRSARRYKGLRREEALRVARERLPGKLGQKAFKPLRLREGQRVENYMGRFSAQVVSRDGDGNERTGLAESSVPLRSAVGTGELNEVSYVLQDEGGAFEPANPLVATSISKDLAEGASLPGRRIRARPAFGAGSGEPTAAEGAVFWSNVGADDGTMADTDVLIAPTTRGFESSWILRTEDSPTQLRLILDVPDGASLRKVDIRPTGSPFPESIGGFEIIRDSDGEVLASIDEPIARDAEDTAVEVIGRAEGNTIVLEVDHRNKDLARPVLVDPTINGAAVDNFRLDGYGNRTGAAEAWGGWDYLYAGVPSKDYIPGSKQTDGLTLFFYKNINYPDGAYGQFIYRAPRQTFIERADFGYVGHAKAQYPDSCVIQGIGHGSIGWQSGSWAQIDGTISESTGNPRPAQGSSPTLRSAEACRELSGNYKAHWVGSQAVPDGAGGDAEGLPGNFASYGLLVNGSGSRAFRGGLVKMEGASIWLHDTDNPFLREPARATPLPNGWVNQYTDQVGLGAEEGGIGVQYFDLAFTKHDGGLVVRRNRLNCVGDRTSRCPNPGNINDTLGLTTYTYDTGSETDPERMQEGLQRVAVVAYDVFGKKSNTREWMLKVDRTAPTVDIDGELDGLDAVGPNPIAVNAEASDDKPGIQTSGLESVELHVNGVNPDPTKYTKQAPECHSSCPPFTPEFSFDPAPYADGRRLEVTIVATDEAGNTSSSDTVPLLVDKRQPDVELRGPLAPGPATFREIAAYTVTMQATDAGPRTDASGFERATLRVDGSEVGTVGGEPNECDDEGGSLSCTVDVTFDLDGIKAKDREPQDSPPPAADREPLADGVHQFELEAYDAAGNVTTRSWAAGADSREPTVELSGTLRDRAGGSVPSGTYTVNVNGADGSSSDPQSGVERLELFVDEQRVAVEVVTCADSSCDGALTYAYSTDDYDAGQHAITATVTDAAGNQETDGFVVSPTEPASCEPTPRSPNTDASRPNVDALAESFDSLLPNALASSLGFLSETLDLTPGLEAASNGFRSLATANAQTIFTDPSAGIRFGDGPLSICVQPEDVAADATAPEQVRDAAVFPGIHPSVDAIERPTSIGSAGVMRLRDPDAPESLSWRVSLTEGQVLKEVAPNVIALITPDVDPDTADEDTGSSDDGADDPDPGSDPEFVQPPEIELPSGETFESPPPGSSELSPEQFNDASRQFDVSQADLDGVGEREYGTLYAIFRVSWARDATGRSLPTTLTASGDRITMNVPHRSQDATYPVVADRTATVVPEQNVVASPRVAMAARARKPFCEGARADTPISYAFGGVRLKGRIAGPVCRGAGAPRRLRRVRTFTCIERTRTPGNDDSWRRVDCDTENRFGRGASAGYAPYLRVSCLPGVASYRTKGSVKVFFDGNVAVTRRDTSGRRGLLCKESALWTYGALDDPGQPSQRLAASMRASGDEKPLPYGFAAHHIIPVALARAAFARAYGWRCRIQPNRVPNGSWLRTKRTRAQGEGGARRDSRGYRRLSGSDRKRAYHNGLHTVVHYQWVKRKFQLDALGPGGSCNRADGLRTLRNIKDLLESTPVPR